MAVHVLWQIYIEEGENCRYLQYAMKKSFSYILIFSRKSIDFSGFTGNFGIWTGEKPGQFQNQADVGQGLHSSGLLWGSAKIPGLFAAEIYHARVTLVCIHMFHALFIYIYIVLLNKSIFLKIVFYVY